jgi:hypothetical protein
VKEKEKWMAMVDDYCDNYESVFTNEVD